MRQLTFREAQQVAGGLWEDGVTTYAFNGEGWTVWGDASFPDASPIWEGYYYNGGFYGVGDDVGGSAGTIPDSTTGQSVGAILGLAAIALGGVVAALGPVTLTAAIAYNGALVLTAASRTANGVTDATP